MTKSIDYRLEKIPNHKAARLALEEFLKNEQCKELPWVVYFTLMQFQFKCDQTSDMAINGDSFESYTITIRKPYFMRFTFNYDFKKDTFELYIEYDQEDVKKN